MPTRLRLFAVIVMLLPWTAFAAEPTTVNVWPGKPPGDTAELPPEQDIAKPGEVGPGGRPIMKITNVSTPTLAVYKPRERDSGAAIIVCPGGGHRILAYDLEGTEVAEWLNSIGVTAIVLKYRVPARDETKRWLAAVQDAQRSVSVVRSRASDWQLDPQRLGVLGFSAGGETAALTAIFGDERQYAPLDDIDKVSARPDFAVLVYPGGLLQRDSTKLQDYVRVSAETPPMFLAHAFDDPVHPANSIELALALKEASVRSELHLYASGGHGFGLRASEHPCSKWPARCEEWLQKEGWLSAAK